MTTIIERIKRFLRYDIPWRKQAIDQAAHFGAAFLFLAPAAWIAGPLGYGLSGAFMGLIREFTEGGGFGWRSCLDVAFWALGGAALGALA
jgi:hypothetical protein